MTYRDEVVKDTINGLAVQFNTDERVRAARLLLEGTDHEVTKVEKAEDLLSHLAGWAPGNLQHHLVHDHPELKGPFPYDGPLNQIHTDAHGGKL